MILVNMNFERNYQICWVLYYLGPISSLLSWQQMDTLYEFLIYQKANEPIWISAACTFSNSC